MKKIRLQEEDERKINVGGVLLVVFVCVCVCVVLCVCGVWCGVCVVCVRVFVCVYLAFPALWGPNKNSNTIHFDLAGHFLIYLFLDNLKM